MILHLLLRGTATILLDMNLSPEWVTFFEEHDIPAVHWSSIGNPCASDIDILSYARDHDSIVFTHDLDFGMLLAVNMHDKPSVLQLRGHDIMPQTIGLTIVQALRQCSEILSQSALIMIDAHKQRIRMLPLQH